MVVTPAAFKASVANATPPESVAGPLAALWWAAKADWEKAHAIVMNDEGSDAAAALLFRGIPVVAVREADRLDNGRNAKNDSLAQQQPSWLPRRARRSRA